MFGNLNVATGEIVAPMLNATRTELDFAENIDRIVATDPTVGWGCVRQLEHTLIGNIGDAGGDPL